jgi:hypothetical protein
MKSHRCSHEAATCHDNSHNKDFNVIHMIIVHGEAPALPNTIDV